jgi:protein O-mannosyl-transferase
MLNKININPAKQKLIVYVVLTLVTLAVFWQVNQYDFINFDDDIYVTENSHVQSGITLDNIRWAFSTLHAEFWHPLTWISLLFDNQLYGLNAGGYHMTNVILHILSTLLLFWLFNRMTGAIWKSAFVAAVFALHPLHVEPVAWISQRKDVLCAFFWMLTLCFYVYYTEKPVIKRYLPVLFFFVCGLMSKSMIVTLPFVMILLDYWPLKRFNLPKGNVIFWQFKEKMPFIVLSAVFSTVTVYAQRIYLVNTYSAGSKFANSTVSFVTYLEKTFWPHDMAIFYPFADQLPFRQVLGSTLLIIFISIAIIIVWKRLPYLFVGWLWYAVTLLPVIGIIRTSAHSMHDKYTYLPSIGLAIMLAWGIGPLIKNEVLRKKILFLAAITLFAVMSALTWKQCGYWKNSAVLWSRALQVTKDNYLAYNGRGMAYGELHRYERAFEDFNLSIRLKPDYAYPYYNRGNIYSMRGQYQQAIDDYNRAISLRLDSAYVYNNRGIAYLKQDNKESGCLDVQKACELGDCGLFKLLKDKGDCR